VPLGSPKARIAFGLLEALREISFATAGGPCREDWPVTFLGDHQPKKAPRGVLWDGEKPRGDKVCEPHRY
jgi:hypothetical protein